MSNNLEDLNSILFAQLGRITDPKLKGEALQDEIKRSETVTKITNTVIQNGNLVLKAATVRYERMSGEDDLPGFLAIDQKAVTNGK